METMEQRIIVFLLSARNGYGAMSLLALILVVIPFFWTGSYSPELFMVLVLGQGVYWISYLYYQRRISRDGMNGDA
jgi:hypothetical protein